MKYLVFLSTMILSLLAYADTTKTYNEAELTMRATRNWEFAASTKDFKVFIYKKPVIKGQNVKVWNLYAFRDGYPSKSLSHKSYDEYQCDERKMRTLQIVTYSGYFGYGEVLSNYDYSNDSPTYASPTPDGIGEAMMEMACVHAKK